MKEIKKGLKINFKPFLCCSTRTYDFFNSISLYMNISEKSTFNQNSPIISQERFNTKLKPKYPLFCPRMKSPAELTTGPARLNTNV